MQSLALSLNGSQHLWHTGSDSNTHLAVLETAALPIELPAYVCGWWDSNPRNNGMVTAMPVPTGTHPHVARLSRLPADRFYDGLLVNSAQPHLQRAA